MTAYGMQPMVTVHSRIVFEAAKHRETIVRAMHHCGRHGMTEPDHRTGCESLEQLIEAEDLLPVGPLGGAGLVMDRDDRGLQLIGTERRPRQRAGDQLDPFGDELLIPSAAVLLGERHQCTAGPGPRRSPAPR